MMMAGIVQERPEQEMSALTGFVNLYIRDLREYIDAIERDNAATRARMLEASQTGRLPYPFADVILAERAMLEGEDPLNYTRIVTSALLQLERDIRTSSDNLAPTLNQAIELYLSLDKYNSQTGEGMDAISRLRLWKEMFPVVEYINDYLISNYEIKHLRPGKGGQITINLAVIYAGRLLLHS